jgi:hypothetical protein
MSDGQRQHAEKHISDSFKHVIISIRMDKDGAFAHICFVHVHGVGEMP